MLCNCDMAQWSSKIIKGQIFKEEQKMIQYCYSKKGSYTYIKHVPG